MEAFMREDLEKWEDLRWQDELLREGDGEGGERDLTT